MNSYSSNWNTPYESLIVTAGEFQKCNFAILEERYAIKFRFKLGKMPQKHMECFRLLFDDLAWIEHQFLSGIRDSRKARSLWGIMRGVRGVRKSIHQSWLAKRLGLGLLCPSRSCWNGTTSVLRPEEITSKGTRVSCVYYQWKCPYEKSLETYLMILVYTYIFIYMYINRCLRTLIALIFVNFFFLIVLPLVILFVLCMDLGH